MKFNGDRVKLKTKMLKTTSVLLRYLGHKKSIISSRESVQVLMRVMEETISESWGSAFGRSVVPARRKRASGDQGEKSL